MKKQGAKKRIILIAKELIDKTGYANTNIINIAKKANVSVGTLYYHFPRGKIDILLAITRKFAQDFEEEAKRLGYTAGKEFSNIKDALNYYLSLIIKLHKKYRLTLAAWESEVLSNLDYYIQLRDTVDLNKELQNEMNLFVGEMKELIYRYPNENIDIRGKEKQLFVIIQAIIHKYSYDTYGFNSDKELIELLSTIIFAILRNKD